MSHEVLIFIWFILLAVLWIGFFFLEGFDFGVAMLYPVIGRNPTERRVMINTIGPTWDGNEVWLITAGGAMFAAFPGWYSSLFSGLYIPLLLVLLALIARGVSFEYRALKPDDNWRDAFDACGAIGSFLVTLVFGVAFANFWIGIPLGGEPPLVTSSMWSLFTPFGLLGGVMLVVLFAAHGGIFLSLKTDGIVRENAHKVVRIAGPLATALVAAFVVFGHVVYPVTDNPYITTSIPTWILGIVAVLALALATVFHSRKAEGSAFAATGVTIATLFAMIFVKMYGTLGFIIEPGTNFDMWIAASSPGTLKTMTIVALIMVPIVLAYTIWTYWVFRKRLTVEQMPPEPSAVAAA